MSPSGPIYPHDPTIAWLIAVITCVQLSMLAQLVWLSSRNRPARQPARRKVPRHGTQRPNGTGLWIPDTRRRTRTRAKAAERRRLVRVASPPRRLPGRSK